MSALESTDPGSLRSSRVARSAQTACRRTGAVAVLSRVMTILGVTFLIGMLPWLSGRDPAVSIFRTRYAEGEMSPEALGAIRADLGVEGGTFNIFITWLGKALSGDLGDSWITRKPVVTEVATAMGTSLQLMLAAVVVAVVVAVCLSIPTLRRGLNGRSDRTNGGLAAAFTALPQFLLASVLLVVFSVWLGWLPPFGWGRSENAVLPALALGLGAGGLTGRLLSDALARTFGERWVATWTVAGYSRTRIALAATRRALPGISGPLALVLVALTAGAVAVESVYAIGGIGGTALAAAKSQDLPLLQGSIIVLMLLAVAVGVGASLLRRVLLGPALRSGTIPAAVPKAPSPRSAWVLPIIMLILLSGLVIAGVLRDPYALDHKRLAGPSWILPLGADASGRDLLARVGHGALSTIGLAVLVALVCLAVGLLLGLVPNLALGPIEIANAAPPVIAGLVVAAAFGASPFGAAAAVALVSWAPLAAHASALVAEVRAQPHVQIAPVLGVGPARLMFRYVLPGVVGPVSRHAALRLPGIALELAALGFLGLGPQPPTPDWGLVLAEGLPYVERAPLAVLVPAGALVMLSVFAVSLSSLTIDLRGGRHPLRRRASTAGSPSATTSLTP